MQRSARSILTLNISTLGLASVLVCIVIVSWVTSHHLATTNERVQRTLNTSLRLTRLATSLEETETSQRGYLLTRDTGELDLYHRARAEVQDHLDALERMAAGDSFTSTHLAILRGLTVRKFAELDQTIALERQGRDDKALAIVESGEGQAVMEQMRGELSAMHDHEASLFEERDHAVAEALRDARGTFVASSFVAVIATLLFYFAVRRNLLLQEQTDAEIRIRQEWLDQTLSSIGDAVIATDARGRVVFINHVAAALTGYLGLTAVGVPVQTVFPVHHEHTLEPVPNPVRRVIEAGAAVNLEYHSVLKRGDGATVPIDDSAAPIRDARGRLVGVVLVFRDVTAKRHAEMERELAIRRYSSLISSIQEGFAAFDAAWNVTFINEHGAGMLGCPITSITGRNLWSVFPELAGSEFEQSFRTAIAERRPVRFTAPWKSTGLLLQVQAYPAEEGLSVLLLDVTQQAQLERALITSEKLAAAGRLAATIAHEINNPLESIMNLVFLSRQQLQNGPSRDYLEQAERELQRVSTICRQTLGFYREQREPGPFELSTLLDDVLRFQKTHRRAPEVRFEQDIATTPSLFGLAGEIRQVFYNLLTNAVDACAPRGTVTVRAKVEATDAVVEIEDTGGGIAPAVRANIFEPFFTTKKDIGTGLGLWVARGIIEKHGGSITFRTSDAPENHGTVFTVRLPLAGHENAAQARAV